MADGELAAENDNGTWIDYVRLNGRLIGRVSGGQVYAIHADQVDRPEEVTDASKAVVWRAQNYPFTQAVTLANVTLNLGFPGQYYDAETGTWNNGFRDYNSALGRYIESDPIGLGGGVNTYAYVGDNPIGYVDPSGLLCTSAQSTLNKIEQSFVSFLAGHISQTLTFDAGAGLGAEGSLTVTENGNSIDISGRFGLGGGLGFGASATTDYSAGHAKGFGVLLSNTGGVGGLMRQASLAAKEVRQGQSVLV